MIYHIIYDIPYTICRILYIILCRTSFIIFYSLKFFMKCVYGVSPWPHAVYFMSSTFSNLLVSLLFSSLLFSSLISLFFLFSLLFSPLLFSSLVFSSLLFSVRRPSERPFRAIYPSEQEDPVSYDPYGLSVWAGFSWGTCVHFYSCLHFYSSVG